jgi:hypothetical protein
MPTTRRRRKRCRFCGESFLADPRLGSRHVACSQPECQKARKRENQADWLKRHPGYFTGRYPKVKRWIEAHPGYLAEYRRQHPEYVQRDNAQRKERHQLSREARADMQDSIALQVPVLQRLRPFLPESPRADMQDSSRSEAVLVSIFSSRFSTRLRRRHARLDRLRTDRRIPSPP